MAAALPPPTPGPPMALRAISLENHMNKVWYEDHMYQVIGPD